MKNSRNSRLVLEQQGAVAIIRFTRPEARNPLSSETLTALEESLEELKRDGAFKALIFTGTDDVFAAGADISEISTLKLQSAQAFAKRGQSIMGRIESLPVLTIAVINGFCMGGALDLALACKLRFASPNAVFSHPGTKLGIITGWGGTQRLPRLVGVGCALELFLTAKRLRADDAARIGLINGVITDPLEHALNVAVSLVSQTSSS